MKFFKRIAAFAVAVVTALAAVQVTAGAASNSWMQSAEILTSGKTMKGVLPADGSWLDFQLTAESDGVVVIDAKICASKSKISVVNSKGSSISTNAKTITGTASGTTYSWNKVSEYSEFTRSFTAKEGMTYYIRLAKGAKTATGSLDASLTVTIPSGNAFRSSPEIKLGKTKTADLDTKGEEAYYTVDVPSKGVLSLGINFEVNSARVALYNADGKKITPSDKSFELGTGSINAKNMYGSMNWKSSSKSGKCSFDFSVDAGRYYIWISNTGGSAGTGDISVTPEFYGENDAELTMLSVKVNKGGSIQLLAAVEGKGNVEWSSSDPSVATVSSTGKVVGKKKGNAVITVTCGGKSLSVNVTVV